MQICPDPLEAIHSIGPDQQWCVTLPACYPNIFPHIPNNVEYNGEKAPNTSALNIDDNAYDCTSIIDSSLCANSKLIQRLRHKIDLYQTSSSNNIRKNHQHLTNIVKQHVSNSDRQDRINRNIQHDILPMSNSVVSKPRNPSFAQQITNRKNTNEYVLSSGSSQHSNLSDSSLYSTDSSTYNHQTNDDSSQFSPTQSIGSLSTENENHYDDIDSRSTTNDRNDRTSSVMSIPVPSISRTPHVSKQQIIANDQLRQSIHSLMASMSHPSDGHIISATKIKSSGSLSPSDNQQRVDSILSSKQSTSTIQSPTSYTSDSEKQELLTPSSTSIRSQYSSQVENTSVKSHKDKNRTERKKDYPHRSSKELRNNKIRKQNSWFEKLTKKLSNKHLQTRSFDDSSPDNISHTYINNRNIFDCLDHLHMKDAMAALEFNLTEEACQTLTNKKNDSQQNRLMRLITAPSRCCRSCRTQRRLATIAQRSIDIAIKNSTNIYR